MKHAGATETIVMLDFYADWCAPCRRVSPLLTELASEFEGKIRIVRVDADNNSAMVDRHQVYSLPTVVFLRNKREIDRMVGAKSKAQYRAAIIKSLKKGQSSSAGKRKHAKR